MPVSQPTAVLLYDADCGFCTASANWLRRRRLAVAVEPLQDADLAALGVDPDRAAREIPLVERAAPGYRVSYGHRAIAGALTTGSFPWRLAGWLLLHPPVCWPAAAVYALLARYRHRLPGGSQACRIDRERPAPRRDHR